MNINIVQVQIYLKKLRNNNKIMFMKIKIKIVLMKSMMLYAILIINFDNIAFFCKSHHNFLIEKFFHS